MTSITIEMKSDSEQPDATSRLPKLYFDTPNNTPAVKVMAALIDLQQIGRSSRQASPIRFVDYDPSGGFPAPDWLTELTCDFTVEAFFRPEGTTSKIMSSQCDHIDIGALCADHKW